eukprot:GFUD01099766.1.p1 GENE.GFUD01099766.1~~GFUD01099766.1.p1  ORF type:complete len:387 (-),score=87.47 GFUD01099766.1:107-1267(-)
MKTIICLVVLIIGVIAFPQAETGCGQDERGVSRKPGDRWQEDCNRCRCLTAGIPGCTKRLCGNFPIAPQKKECKDSLGNTREEGGQWEDGSEICSCGGGVVVCNTLIAITDVKRDKTSGGISFPGSKQQTKEASSTCTDSDGIKRQEGESWKEDCNSCKCFSGSIPPACTIALCEVSEEDLQADSDDSCQSWQDCSAECPQDVGCICKNGKCKISSGCGTIFSFFRTACSSCSEDGCEDEGACKWMNGQCLPGSKQQTKEASSTCTDSAGIKRQEGESWEEDCNSCRCFSGSLPPACTTALCEVIDEDLQADSDESCQSWKDCFALGKKCNGIQDVGCICKNGKCKISSGCGTMGAFFRTSCSSCSEDGCEDEGACKWRNGQCLTA